MEYIGSISTSHSGLPCTPWNDSLNPSDHRFFQELSDFHSSSCRNPFSEDSPPWCFIDFRGTRETCDIPTCSCSQGWFRCIGSGLCIPNDLLCNGQPNCRDGSDEEQPCTSLISQDCGFETAFLCGYKRYQSPVLTWKRMTTYRDVENGDSYSMHLTYVTSIPGSTAHLMTPSQTFDSDGGLRFYVTISKDLFDMDTTLSLHLRHPLGAIVTLTDISLGNGYYLVCIPSGTYLIDFQATLGSSLQPDIIVDRITWHRQDEFMNSRTIAEHCNHKWPVIEHKQSFTAFNCTFTESDCEMTDIMTSNANFKWKKNSLSNILEGTETSTGCMSIITQTAGTMISPGYPNGYPNNLYCNITFIHDRSPLTITFNDFKLEDHQDCEFDFVQVFESSDPSNVVFKSCGSNLPRNITTVFNSTTFLFRTDYSVVDRGYSFYFNVAKNKSEETVYGLTYMGTNQAIPLITHLTLPKMVVDGVSCLSFDIMARNSFAVYSTTRLNNLEMKGLMRVPESHPNKNDSWFDGLRGLGSMMHHITIHLSGRKNEITFVQLVTAVDMSSRAVSTLIDNIMLRPAKCQNLYLNGSMECAFADSSQCGYTDISKGPVKWLRGYNDFLKEYRMFTLFDVNWTTKPSILISPPTTIPTPSCLEVTVQSFNISATLTISLLYANKSLVDLRRIESTELSGAQGPYPLVVDLWPGRYRLVINAEGWSGYLTILGITLESTPCPNTLQPCENTTLPTSLMSQDCGFEKPCICGYTVYSTSNLTWERALLDTSNNDSYSMHLSVNMAPPGSTAFLLSPSRTFDLDGGLSFYMDVRRRPDDLNTMLVVYLGHPLGTIFSPLTDIDIGDGLHLVCIPSGSHVIYFQAAVGSSPQPDIILDRVKWHRKEEELGQQTIEELCNTSWSVLDDDPSSTAFNCTFTNDNCNMTDVITSNINFGWRRDSEAGILNEKPIYSESGCASNIYQDSGTFSSPGYPGNYPSNMDCFITFYQDSAPLTITFTDFHLEGGTSCVFDYIQIYESSNSSNIVLKACGSELPDIIITSFNSTTLHFHSDQSSTDRGYSFQYEVADSYNDEKAYGLRYVGTTVRSPLNNRLTLPSMVVDGHSCLSFELMARHSVNIYSYTSLNKVAEKVRMQVHESHPHTYGIWTSGLRGLGPMSHRIAIQLSGRSNETTIVQLVTTARLPSYAFATGLDNIVLQPGKCRDMYINGSLDCSFTNSRQCGYMDISDGPSKWLRGYSLYLEEYRMFTVHNENIKGNPVRLLSPLANVSTPSCLNIYLEAFATATTFTVAMLLEDESMVHLRSFDSWKLLSTTKDQPLLVDLEVGRYRLLLEGDVLNGVITIIKIDIASATCSEDNSGDAAIPVWLQASPPPLMPTLSVSSPPKRRHDRGQAQKEILEDLQNDQDGVDVKNLVVRASHSWNDSLLVCRWNGEICNDSFITQKVTNMGLCFVFNADQRNILESTTSGAEKGLKLLFNIEAYDEIDGITSNKGLKVLLDHQDDEQNMKDKGLGVGPGMHSLLSIAYSEGTFLKPKWGTCGELELPYYANESYTYERCTQACAVTTMMDMCECGDAYMEGQSTLCDLKRYLNCVLPAAYSGGEIVTSDCQKCISACTNYKYDPTLSSTLLSARVINELSYAMQTRIATNGSKAYELKQRVSVDVMVRILEQEQRVIDSLNKVTSHIHFNLLDPRSSVIARAEQSVNMFGESLTEDYSSLYDHINSSMREYTRILSSKVNALAAACEQSRNDLATAQVHHTGLRYRVYEHMGNSYEMEQLWFNRGVPFYYSLVQLYRSANDVLVMKQSEVFHSNEIFHVNDISRNKYLPEFLVAPRFLYNSCMDMAVDYIREMEYVSQSILDVLNVINPDFPKTNWTVIPFNVTRDSHLFLELVISFEELLNYDQFADPTNTISCILNYVRFLHSAHEPSTTSISYSSILKSPKTLAELRSGVAEIRKLNEQFSLNQIGIIALRDRFLDLKVDIENVLSDLTSNVRQRIITPMLGSLEYLQNKYSTDVTQFVDHAVLLTSYIPLEAGNVLEYISNAKLWQRPLANLHGWQSYELLRFTLEEGAGVNIIGPALGVFRNKTGKAVIRRSVGDFFTSVYSGVQAPFIDLLGLVNTVDTTLQEFVELLQDQTQSDILSREFIGDNVLQLDIYYTDMSLTKVVQKKSYDLLAFFSDFGGYMGLLLGASIISLVELIDWIIFHCVMKPGNEDDEHKSNQNCDDQRQMSLSNAHFTRALSSDDLPRAHQIPIKFADQYRRHRQYNFEGSG